MTDSTVKAAFKDGKLTKERASQIYTQDLNNLRGLMTVIVSEPKVLEAIVDALYQVYEDRYVTEKQQEDEKGSTED